jgi:hypothetical protein
MNWLYALFLATHSLFGGVAISHPVHCQVVSVHYGVALGSTVTETTMKCGKRVFTKTVIVPNEQ